MDKIVHITVNNGHSHTSRRCEIDEMTIEALMTIVEHGEGGLDPYMPGYSIKIQRDNGSAMFTIFSVRGAPVTMSAVATTDVAAIDLWAVITRPIMPHAGHFKVHYPKGLPWIATQLLVPDVSPEDAYKLGDIERMIAWAIIEHPEAGL